MLAAPCIRRRRTPASAARGPPRARATCCSARWPPAHRSRARWSRPRWASPPSASRSSPRATSTCGARSASATPAWGSRRSGCASTSTRRTRPPSSSRRCARRPTATASCSRRCASRRRSCWREAPAGDRVLHAVPLAAARGVDGPGAADHVPRRPGRGRPEARQRRHLRDPARRRDDLVAQGRGRFPRAARPQGPRARPHRAGPLAGTHGPRRGVDRGLDALATPAVAPRVRRRREAPRRRTGAGRAQRRVRRRRRGRGARRAAGAARGRAPDPPRTAPRQPADGHRRAAPDAAGHRVAAPGAGALARGGEAVTPSLAPEEVLRRVEGDVRRAVRRGRNGLRYAAGTDRPKVGRTPKDVVWKRDKAELWRYRSDAVAYTPPVVIVHSLVSRSYVLDLAPDNSAVGALLAAGLDVMLVDWGVADAVEADNTLETYSDGYLPEAIEAACDAAGSDEVTILGYCFGGLLSLLTVARHPELPVLNLAVMATPVDFTGLSAMTGVLRGGRLDSDDLLDETGNVPPEAVENAFRLLRPTGDLASYATLWQNLWNDKYVEGYQAMAQWTRDHVPFPGAAFRQTVEQLVRDNALVSGDLRLGGQTVDLSAITCPFLNVMAERDHIVPIESARPLTGLVGSADVEELCLPAGHVGLVASRTAAKVTLPRIADWMQRHSETPAAAPRGPRRGAPGTPTLPPEPEEP